MKFNILVRTILVVWYHDIIVTAQPVGSNSHKNNLMDSITKYLSYGDGIKNKVWDCFNKGMECFNSGDFMSLQGIENDIPSSSPQSGYEEKSSKDQQGSSKYYKSFDYDSSSPQIIEYDLSSPQDYEYDNYSPQKPQHYTTSPENFKYGKPPQQNKPKYNSKPPKQQQQNEYEESPEKQKKNKYEEPSEKNSDYGNLGFNPNEMLKLVNAKRSESGAPPVKLSDKLMKVAQKHSVWMSSNGMHHNGEGGSQPCNRCKDAGYMPNFCTENIAQRQKSVSDVMESWIKSPGHLENILDREAKEVGFGMYKNSWTQLFGQGEKPRSDGMMVVCPDPNGRYADQYSDSQYGVTTPNPNTMSQGYNFGGMNNLNYGNRGYGNQGSYGSYSY